MRLFIPGLERDLGATRRRWARFVQMSRAPVDAPAIRKIRFEKEGYLYDYEVGLEQSRRGRITGPRGGHIKDAGYQQHSFKYGKVVLAIVDVGSHLMVWIGSATEVAQGEMVGVNQYLTVLERFEPLDGAAGAASVPGVST